MMIRGRCGAHHATRGRHRPLYRSGGKVSEGNVSLTYEDERRRVNLRELLGNGWIE